MDTLSLRITYRPLRIGWCVRHRNMDDVRRTLRRTHTLWGGRYNPIIPVGTDVDGRGLVRSFGVDVLYPAAEVPELTEFAESFPYLRWPGHFRSADFFVETNHGLQAPFLDISYPVFQLHEEYVKGEQKTGISVTLFSWDPADPLADVFLAQFGSYPSTEDTGLDYVGFITKLLDGKSLSLETDGPVPADAFKAITPSAITRFDLAASGLVAKKDGGFYVGDANNFEDVVNLWNLRAANIEVYFFDVRHENRLGGLRDAYVQWIQSRNREPRDFPPAVAIWTREGGPTFSLGAFGQHLSGGRIHRCVPTSLKPSPMQFKERSVLASVSESTGKALISVQLPDKPFRENGAFPPQLMVVGIQPGFGFASDPDKTLVTPYLPEMNEFYRREMIIAGDEIRVQQDGFGIITSADCSDISFYALQASRVIAAVFEVFGIHAEPSLPGQIGKRIIHQMNGLQGCRVFKLPGVRRLIEEFGPLKSFTRGAATVMIAQVDPVTQRPNLPILFVEGTQLTSSSAFDYLLKKGAFRTGLDLVCPNCSLEFWLALESLGHEVVCEYCGKAFNVTRQLRDRDWRYRRSGLFGKDNHQEGAIPVVLTLQQLETNVHSILGSRLFETSFKLSSAGAKISPSETDLVALMQDIHGDVQLLIGECKSGGLTNEITEDDVKNLVAVAKSFPPERITVYLLFSKTASFSADEITRCMTAQDPSRPRVILLTDRELEPYHVYERTQKEFDIRGTAISLKDLAEATPRIFFQPKTKRSTAVPATAVVEQHENQSTTSLANTTNQAGNSNTEAASNVREPNIEEASEK